MLIFFQYLLYYINYLFLFVLAKYFRFLMNYFLNNKFINFVFSLILIIN